LPLALGQDTNGAQHLHVDELPRRVEHAAGEQNVSEEVIAVASNQRQPLFTA
jgi:hypothetical protein